MMRPVRLTVSPSRISAVLAEQHGADALLFEVERDAEDAVRELEHLARHRLLDPMHASDAVANRHDRADLRHVDVDGVAADLVANDLGDFFRFDVHNYSEGLRPSDSPSRSLAWLASLRSLASGSRPCLTVAPANLTVGL